MPTPLEDGLAALSSAVDAATQRVQTDVAASKAEIARLQALVDAGGASPADIQLLADLTTKVNAIDPTSSVTMAAVKHHP